MTHPTLQKSIKEVEERVEVALDTYESLIDSNQSEYKMARDYIKSFIKSEKQLSYQEAVEKVVKTMNKLLRKESLAGCYDSLEMEWTEARNELRAEIRHQLSILKGEK